MMEAALAAGLDVLGLVITDAQQRKLLDYLALMARWNKVYNLTAIRAPEQMLVQHVFDSLAVSRFLPAGLLLDIGAGGGLPGIPLAVARPDLAVTLLDSNQKKTTFLRQAVIELKLENAEVVCARAEDFKPQAPFDMAISRAFSDLALFVRLAGPHCRPGGNLFAMKGVYPQAELEYLEAGHGTFRVESLLVPGLDAQRHLVIIGL